MIDIATFDVVPSEDINEEFFILPEAEPYNINFQQSRIDSVYAITNVGTIFYILIIYAVLILVERSWSLLSRKCQKGVKYLTKLQ